MRWGGGLKVAWGFPTGSAVNGSPLSDWTGGQLHFEGSGDLVILRRLVLGANVGFGIGSTGSGYDNACNGDGVSCSALDVDFGVHAEYRFLPDNMINPWVGLGVGYEFLIEHADDGEGDTADETLGGAYVDISGGVDFQAGPFGIGPFLGYRFGTYTSKSFSDSNGDEVDTGVLNNAGHGWFMLGVRGRY